MPQYAIAQLGSCRSTPSNVRRAIRNQYEWIIATPRSNSAWTLGSQEVGKLSLPSFSSCWPRAPQLSAAVIPMTSIRYFGFMGTSGRPCDRSQPPQRTTAKYFRDVTLVDWHQAQARKSAPSPGILHWQFTHDEFFSGMLIPVRHFLQRISGRPAA